MALVLVLFISIDAILVSEDIYCCKNFVLLSSSTVTKCSSQEMSEPSGSQYAADFTSVKAAMEGTCNCGVTAVPKHMYSKDHSKLGQDLYPICYQYYCNKQTTIHHSSAQTPKVEHTASHQCIVHKHIAQA